MPTGAIHHLAYVVTDLEAGARQWHDLTGIGPFLAAPHYPFDEILVDGAEAVFDHTPAFAAYGDIFIELQLIHRAEPEAARRRFAVTGAPGPSHIAYTEADAAAESARLAAAGLPVVVRGRSGDLSFTWHDAPQLGCTIELHQESDYLRDFFGQVSRAAQGWDGRELVRFPA